ncbi:aspartate--tRNA ligase [Candidatus Profftella armatura (Diaphorina cf. continua)]|uniref:Aspartate--tRNA(Asp/Asn) ligase n=1 Tax=Candidatus Profftella armatura (Diaphorina cf. continua) TaxID=2661583 RepID=A0A7R6VZ19_9PROT|nr:aspartate--tRNA ligase [Candidatus Profftella armatura (Diaphorina cf. continua)]BCG49739.1 aspartate--tRNA ligase [Candidatus Profftella armatura (Diaphorina cf. continua)]
MRTHYCGNITEKLLNQVISLCGWVHRQRNHGGIIFIDLRDYTGLVQIVCDPNYIKISKISKIIRSEFCLQIIGKVRKRPNKTNNTNLISGNIEILCRKLKILNSSVTLPFQIDEENILEVTNLKYRVLYLRYKHMQKNLRLRHKVTMEIRKFLDSKKFIEIETPILGKSTPEGARDYLVPSRINPGKFFALPQSPQLFKQLLMIANFDRYYQITKCFRDEDLRSDRQPEFTQIDCEVSFMNEEEIRSLFENMIRVIFDKTLNIKLPNPFPIIEWSTAIKLYGSDKPDTRIKLIFTNLTNIMKNVNFKLFSKIANMKNGKIIGLKIPGGLDISRNEIDSYTQFVKTHGAKGLVYIKIHKISKGLDGLKSPIIKYFNNLTLEKIIYKTKAQNGDIIFLGADEKNIVNNFMSALRIKIGCSDFGKKNNIFDNNWRPLWVINFPMFKYDETNNNWIARHHPFTAPKDGYEDFILTNPEKIFSKAYDLIINGREIGGGSIRIHNAKIQKNIFKVLNINDEIVKTQFEFLLNSLKYGAPPHGGIAFGLDRLITIMTGSKSIRDVIAFPKTQNAQCLLTNTPSIVDKKQLNELNILYKNTKINKNLY